MRGWVICTAVGGVLAMLLACASPTQARTSYSPSGAFGEIGFGPGQLSGGANQLGVQESTGRVFVMDGSQSISVFAPATDGTATLEFTIPVDFTPSAIALDQANGALYVGGDPNSVGGTLARYVSNGAPTPTYTRDASFTAPPLGSDEGQVANYAQLAVDPDTRDLLVADGTSSVISRFSVTGQYLSRFTGTGRPGGTFGPGFGGLTIGPDRTVYVAATTTEGSRTAVDAFGSDGTYLRSFELGAAPQALAFDPDAQNVIGGYFDVPTNTSKVVVARENAPNITLSIDGSSGSLVGLAVDRGNAHRLYVGLAGGPLGVQTFEPIVLPDVTLADPADVTSTSVRASGTVNPLGTQATATFETSADGGQTWTAGGQIDVGSGSAAVPVEQTISGLTPNTAYRLRLTATSDSGTALTEPKSFTTAKDAPRAATGGTSDETSTSAVLRGAVNPFGEQATYHFEYGTDTGYGSRAPAGADALAGSGRTDRPVSQPVTGLAPGTTYHYRLVARNASGVTEGPDRTFTTPGVATARAYEMVTPVEKRGAEATRSVNFDVSDDGETLLFPSSVAMFDQPAAPLRPENIAFRGTQGWSARPLDPPAGQVGFGSPNINTTIAMSRDGARAFVISSAALAPGATEGGSNIYLEDTRTGAYTLVATSTSPSHYLRVRFSLQGFSFAGGSDDFRTLAFYDSGTDNAPFLPGAPPNAVYVWSDGVLRIGSRIGPNSVAASTNVSDLRLRGRALSADGRRLWFGAQGTVYRRDGEAAAVPIAISERPGDGTDPQPAEFKSSSRDGRYGFIEAGPLTPDAPTNQGDALLYRYDANAPAGARLTYIAPSHFAKGNVSDDGSTALFSSRQPLTPGVPDDFETRTYVWRNGQIRLVSPVLDAARLGGAPVYSISPAGRTIAFESDADLTGQSVTSCREGLGPPGQPCVEVYRFDTESGDLSCASCVRDGQARGAGHANMGFFQFQQYVKFARPVLDDGRVYFDTTAALADRDVTAARDVYEADGARRTLISAGRGGDSQLSEVDSTGRNVFFTTKDQLVAQDTDDLFDVYDARVGGGIPSQDALPAQPGCAPSACQPGEGAAPLVPPSPSTLAAPVLPERPSRPAAARLRTASARFAGATLRIRVRASGAGRLRASGPRVGAAARPVSRAGTYELAVRLRRAWLRKLRAGQRVRVTVTVRLAPSFGKAATLRLTRTAVPR